MRSKKVDESLFDFITMSTPPDPEQVNRLTDDPDCARSIREMIDIWQVTGMIRRKEYNADRVFRKLKRRIIKERRLADLRKTRIFLAVAATFTLFIVAGYFARDYYLNFSSGAYQEMIVPYGSRSEATLPDGSKVWLNAGSRIRYSRAFNRGNRVVWMTGECYFSVNSSSNSPFIVKTPGLTITSIGTQFNVKAYPDEPTINATLLEGNIKIETFLQDKGNSEPIILQPLQSAVFKKKSTPLPYKSPDESIIDEFMKRPEKVPASMIDIRQNPDAYKLTSWKDGRLIIENEKLESLARKLERRYNVKIRFEDENVKNYVFSGRLENETFEQVMNIIGITSPVTYIFDGNRILISEDKEKRSRLQ